MACPDIRYPLESYSSSLGPSLVRPELTKRVFCLQRHIPCQSDASFLVVWRQSLLSPSSADRNEHSASDDQARVVNSPRRSRDANCRPPRAHSGVFLVPRTHAEDAGVDIEKRADAASDEAQPGRSPPHVAQKLVHLEIEDSKSSTWKALQKRGFNPDVMAPLLFYMKRATSEIANCINLEPNTRQACGALDLDGSHLLWWCNMSVLLASYQVSHASSSWERTTEVCTFQRCVAFSGYQARHPGRFCVKLTLSHGLFASSTRTLVP
jgi:hypothetical protein